MGNGGVSKTPLASRVIDGKLFLERAEAPEDWRAAFELDDEDLLDPDLPLHPEDWNNPLNFIEPDTMYGVDDF